MYAVKRFILTLTRATYHLGFVAALLFIACLLVNAIPSGTQQGEEQQRFLASVFLYGLAISLGIWLAMYAAFRKAQIVWLREWAMIAPESWRRCRQQRIEKAKAQVKGRVK